MPLSNSQTNSYQNGYHQNDFTLGRPSGHTEGANLVSSGYMPTVNMVNSGYANGVSSSSHMVGSSAPPVYSSVQRDETAKFYQSQTFAPRVERSTVLSPQPVMSSSSYNLIGQSTSRQPSASHLVYTQYSPASKLTNTVHHRVN